MPIPTAEEFRRRFVEVFNECREARRDSFEEAWKNWTAFMTGKKTKLDSLGKQAVLPVLAEKLGLKCQEEFMRLDLVFYEREGCPLAVAIEHENKAGDFGTELERLFSVRSRLKVGITYIWNGDRKSLKVKNELEGEIRENYKYYVNDLLPESAKTEYLFLLGNEEKGKSIAWHYLSFDVRSGPQKKSFQLSR